MHRRQVLCAFVVVVALTAGCMNTPRPTLQPPSGEVDTGDGDQSVPTPEPNRFAVPDWETRAGDNTTVIDMEVWNKADQRRGVRVSVSRQIGNRTVAGSTDLVLGANETAPTEITLDVPYDEFWEGSNLDFDLEERSVGA
ncbi:hypothetical protein SAMN05216388_102117 [Halorientalis persicus]|jgi:hypothetical protein|uniref:LEA14-like dessication related protein n=1 Tax=Halorientalis persicus TaxID=1367881 RepID=A0A1H8T4S3_9EURY|nr:hypothetical protein [Halorientalis persicus]SEO85533.1 hypothetical protein SAMN05216388_102117 [Halorientalis persicus]